jgi:hypothetical protein
MQNNPSLNKLKKFRSILMIDPEVLENNVDYAKILEKFLNISNFANSVRLSFNTLKKFCEDWNQVSFHSNKIRLRVYSTIPTASMVMIDPDHTEGEAVIEFFVFNSGENRPRFLCKANGSDESMFYVIKSKYLNLWNDSKKIVE